MPDRLHGFQSGRNDGNPTKSAEVNNFIKNVKWLETRKQPRCKISNAATYEGVRISTATPDFQDIWQGRQFDPLEVWHASFV